MPEAHAKSTARKSKRRWCQFTLRTLLLVVTVTAVLLASWNTFIAPYRAERRAIAAFREHGCLVETEVCGPRWLRKVIGDEHFQTAVSVCVDVRTQIRLQQLRGLRLQYRLAKGSAARLPEHTDELMRLVKQLNETPQPTDDVMVHLASMTNLEVLILPQCQVTDEGLKYLEGLTSLRRLCLENTPVTDEGLKHLSGLANLEWLYLGNNSVLADGTTDRVTRVTDTGLTHLSSLTKLKVLLLGGTEITDAGLEHLKALPNLRQLNVRRTKVTAKGVAELKRTLPNLEDVSF